MRETDFFLLLIECGYVKHNWTSVRYAVMLLLDVIALFCLFDLLS